MADWKMICNIEDIPKLGSRVVKSAEGEIAVFRTSSDEVFALRDKCPHKGGPLSQGIVHGTQVTCPLHSWKPVSYTHLDVYKRQCHCGARRRVVA